MTILWKGPAKMLSTSFTKRKWQAPLACPFPTSLTRSEEHSGDVLKAGEWNRASKWNRVWDERIIHACSSNFVVFSNWTPRGEFPVLIFPFFKTRLSNNNIRLKYRVMLSVQIVSRSLGVPRWIIPSLCHFSNHPNFAIFFLTSRAFPELSLKFSNFSLSPPGFSQFS